MKKWIQQIKHIRIKAIKYVDRFKCKIIFHIQKAWLLSEFSKPIIIIMDK